MLLTPNKSTKFEVFNKELYESEIWIHEFWECSYQTFGRFPLRVSSAIAIFWQFTFLENVQYMHDFDFRLSWSSNTYTLAAAMELFMASPTVSYENRSSTSFCQVVSKMA